MNSLFKSLPEDINNKIFTYSSHPTADMIKVLIKPLKKLNDNFAVAYFIFNKLLQERYEQYKTLQHTRIDFGIYAASPEYFHWRDRLFPADTIAREAGIAYYTIEFLKEYYI